MKKKIKWEVCPMPTGAYSSFFRRNWPSGSVDDSIMFQIICKDEYIPANVKTGSHGELTLQVRIDNKWRSFTKKCATIKEAKELALVYINKEAKQ